LDMLENIDLNANKRKYESTMGKDHEDDRLPILLELVYYHA
jgi:hypothetical protein